MNKGDTHARYDDTEETYSNSDGMRTFQPTGNYKQEHVQIVEEQLEAAGVGLAAILESIANKSN
jgi:hypothetical protein